VDGARCGWPRRNEQIDLASKKFVQKRRDLRRVATGGADKERDLVRLAQSSAGESGQKLDATWFRHRFRARKKKSDLSDSTWLPRCDLIDPTIAVHNGRVVKRTGDGSLVEFRSVVDENQRNFESAVMMSSAMPSAKYSCAGSSLMFWNGNTAIEGLSGSASRNDGFSGLAGSACDAGLG